MRHHDGRLGGAIAVAATALLLTSAGSAAATPAPEQGPTAGGTVVSGTLPDDLAFTAVFAGGLHSVGIASDGLTYAWGNGGNGRLGNGSSTDSAVPVPVSAPAGVEFTAVSTGVMHTLAIGSDGRTYAWGAGSTGRLGNGALTDASVPVAVRAPEGVTFTAVAAGHDHSVGIGSDGRTYAWGRGTAGMLGNGALESSSVPVPVSAPDDVTFTAISAGGAHTVAIGSDGQTYAWGAGPFGQLGNGSTADSSVPVAVSVPVGATFTTVAAGAGHTAATGSDGRTYAWGFGGSGGLGNGSTADSSVPVVVTAPDGVTFTGVVEGADSRHTLAVGSDARTYAWGANWSGQLGDGTTADATTLPVPVSAPAGVTFTSVTAGAGHSMAIGSDGRTYTWGGNTFGQLGDGSTTSSSVPDAGIDTAAAVESVTFGGVPGTDLTQDGTAWTVTAPPHACGAVDVEVTHTQLGRTHTRTTPDGFTYGTPPVVTAHPTGADVPSGGGTVTMSAAADGDSTPDVRWQQAPTGTEVWTDIPGATSTILVAEVSATTDFRATFTNCLGTATTNSATATAPAAAAPGSGPGTDGAQQRPAPAVVPDDGPGGSLAVTGAGSTALVALALALAMVAGGAALFAVRRGWVLG